MTTKYGSPNSPPHHTLPEPRQRWPERAAQTPPEGESSDRRDCRFIRPPVPAVRSFFLLQDWWMRKPLPVDADLLPEEVPGFKPPFRLCPPRNRSKLSDKELTYLRNLAKPLPTHFVLGSCRV